MEKDESIPSTAGKMKGMGQMRKLKTIVRKFKLGITVALCSYALGGCEYEVPITSRA